MKSKSKIKRFTHLKDDGTIGTFECRVIDGKESYILERTKEDVQASQPGRVESCANVYMAKRIVKAIYVMFERYHCFMAFKVKKNGYPSVMKRYAHDDQKWIDQVHDNPHMTKEEIIAQGLAEGIVLVTPVKKAKKRADPKPKSDQPIEPKPRRVTERPRRNRGRGGLGRLFTAKLVPQKKKTA